MSLRHEDILKLLFPIELGGVFPDDVAIEGKHLDSAETSAEKLLQEMFPDTTTELIEECERVLGIVPDPGDTLDVRRERVLSKVREVGGLSKDYFIKLAEALGYTVEIEEIVPFMAGWSAAGDRLYVEDAVFCWKVRVYGVTSAPDLEAKFNALKPAHTYVFFEYQP